MTNRPMFPGIGGPQLPQNQPSNKPNPGQPGTPPGDENVFQMLWDCRFCGTKKLLGLDHRHCPNCGAAQDPAWRYFPTDEDKKAVTDPSYKYEGIDKSCPFCKQPNSAAAKFCVVCGGDLTNATSVELKDEKLASGKAEDLTLKKFQQQQAAIAAQNKGMPGWLKVLLVIGVIALIIGGVIFALSKSTYGSQLKVTDANWERTLQVLQYNVVSGDTWCDSVPGDAYNRISRTDFETKTERYECGSHTEKVDAGNGTFRERTVIEYCNRDVKVQRDKCSYKVNRWQQVGDLLRTQGGINDEPKWPAFTPSGGNNIGAQKAGDMVETYRILFQRVGSDNKQETYLPKTLEEWKQFRINQRYSVNIDRLENIHWDTLKLTD